MGLRKNWQSITMERFLKRKTLSCMMQNSETKTLCQAIEYNDDWEEEKNQRSYFTYANIAKVIDVTYKNIPISVVEINENILGCVIAGEKLLQIERKAYKKIYWECSILLGR